MAKKYLLYIHDERFENEPAKSQLVNELLSGWYGDEEPDSLKVAVEEVKSIYRNEMCPNGHPIPEGRERCMGKGCKYS